MIPNIYELFVITTINEIKCNNCNMIRHTDIVREHALSVEIDNNNIHSIQDALTSFQKTEFVNVNCIGNKCDNNFGYKSLQLINIKLFNHTSKKI